MRVTCFIMKLRRSGYFVAASAALRGRNLLVLSISVLALVAAFFFVGRTTEACGSDCGGTLATGNGVPVEFRALARSAAPYTMDTLYLTVFGQMDTGGPIQGYGCNDYTPVAGRTFLKPGRLYLVRMERYMCEAMMGVDAPPGYDVYIDGKKRNSVYKLDTTGSGLGFAQLYWDVVIRRQGETGGPAGESYKPKLGAVEGDNGNVTWGVNLGYLSDGQSAGAISYMESSLHASSYKPSSLIYTPPPGSRSSGEVEVIRVDNSGNVVSPTFVSHDDPTWNSYQGILRQIRTRQTLVDVVAVNSSEFDIRFYKLADVGGKMNGTYAISGQPFVSYKLRNPELLTYNELEIKKIENNTVTDTAKLKWTPPGGGGFAGLIDDAASFVKRRIGLSDPNEVQNSGPNPPEGSWSLDQGNGNYLETRSAVINPLDSAETIETIEKKNNLGQVSSKIVKTYRSFLWGRETVKEVVDPDGDALTTVYAFYENAAEANRYGKPRSKTGPDGSWESYDYDGVGNLSQIARPFKDAQLAEANYSNSRVTYFYYTNNNGISTDGFAKLVEQEIEYTAGVPTRLTAYSRGSASHNGQTVAVVTENAYSNPYTFSSTTTATYSESATPLLAGRTAYIEFPDGRRDSYIYEKGDYVTNQNPNLNTFSPNVNGTAERATVVHGSVTSPNGIAFRSTKDLTVRDGSGNTVLEESYVYDGSNYERISWAVNSFNDTGRQTSTTKSNGETSVTNWSGDSILSQVDASGVETAYTYDDLDRVKTSVKKGVAAIGGFPAQPDITTTYNYDAEGRALGQTTTAGGITLTQSTTFDKAGRIKTTTDNAGLTTTYAYSNGGRTEAVTLPGGASRITDRFVDGQTKSATGTSVIAKYYDYGVDSNLERNFTTEFIGPNGLSSPRWIKKTFDWLGRSVAVEKPSFTGTNALDLSEYDAKMHLVRERKTKAGSPLSSSVADQLYKYDELGNRTLAGMDISYDGNLTVASTDRISDSDSYYEKIGSDWFKSTVEKTYRKDNNSDAVSKIEKTRLTNFPTNGNEKTTSEIVSIDAGGNQNKSSTVIDPTLKKTTNIRNSAQSASDEVTVTINGLLQSATPATPQGATTFGYDPLGRQTTVASPVVGTKTTAYNPTTGQVTSVADNVGLTAYEYFPPFHPNAGRMKAQTNAAGKKTYFAYDLLGKVTRTWGDTTYPIEFVFDSYGQQTEMRTFRSGSGWSGDTWPTATTGSADVTKWIYQEPTGLLLQKHDASLQGPIYTYDVLSRRVTRKWARQYAGNPVTTTYTYDDKRGDLNVITYSDSTQQVSFVNDRRGQPTIVYDAAGEHRITYNANGELLSQQTVSGILNNTSLTVAYDGYLRRESFQAKVGASVVHGQGYSYDTSGRLKTVTNGAQVATYNYDPARGLLGTTVFTGGTSISRTYDSMGQLESITTTPANDTPVSYAYTYNNLHQRTRVTREDNSYTSVGYNDRGEVTSAKRYWSDNTPVAGMQNEYQYDNIGNRNSSKEGGDATGADLRTSTYTPNGLNQYTQRTVPNSIDVLGTAAQDATVTVNGQPTYRRGKFFQSKLSFSNSNAPLAGQVDVVAAKNNVGAGGEDGVEQKKGQILVPQTPESFAYDLDGNLLSDGLWSYAWDAENRLISMTSISNLPNAAKKKLDFVYDFQGRRIQKKISTWNELTSGYQTQAVTKFVYDGWNVVAELDGNNNAIKSHTWGQDLSGKLRGGGIGGLLFVNYSGGIHQTAYDGNANVVGLVDAATGMTSATYTYDSFGNTLQETGASLLASSFRYSSKYTDQETGLIYYGYRYYNPQTGRWTSKDPVGEEGGTNLYGFVNNDPANKIDQLGMYEIDVHYYLTYYLALNHGCFSSQDARWVAEQDQLTDEFVSTRPGYGDTEQQRYQNRRYHALQSGAAEGQGSIELWNEAVAGEKNYIGLGRYLHYLQDTFSHSGYTDDTYGHSPLNVRYGNGKYGDHLTDKTAYDPAKAQRMVARVWQALNDFAKEQDCKCEGKWKPEMWPRINAFINVMPDSARESTIDANLNDFELANPGVGDPEALRRKRRFLGLPDRYTGAW